MTGYLSALVSGVAVKRLSAVEAHPEISNQHEFNGVQPLKQLFGTQRRTFESTFLYLAESEDQVVSANGFVTWYDARENHPTRSEFRLYFPKTSASERLATDDVALIMLRADSQVLIAFAPSGSTAEQQLLWLFRIAAPSTGIAVKDLRADDSRVGFAGREILNQLGIEPPPDTLTDSSDLELILDRFGGSFPTTSEFSSFAREVTPEADASLDPDESLIMWLEREEALFRILERHLILERLNRGFEQDVDAFVDFSLSVQNRRKARIGQAFEHHFEAVLLAHRISYSRGKITERSSRPDFIFPSIALYHNAHYPAQLLTMLALKSTCKDRWRQVLAEADRIEMKHLLTLEPGISNTQLEEMASRQVVLVVPVTLHSTYNTWQGSNLISVSEFLNLLTTRAGRSPSGSR